MSKTSIRATTASILSATLMLGACGPLPPTRVLAPIQVDDRSTSVPTARLSWHSDGPDTRPGTSNIGLVAEYAQGSGRSDQQVTGNEYISLGGANLLGPQNVRHRAELRYGHVALSGIGRFRGKASGLELQWVAGFGRTELDLRSESRTSADPVLTARYQVTGLVLGVGPRWNITNELALEGRAQVLWSGDISYSFDFVYPEVALRYRPFTNAALRVGYSGMSFNPAKNQGSDSPVEVRIAGPFLGLHVMF